MPPPGTDGETPPAEGVVGEEGDTTPGKGEIRKGFVLYNVLLNWVTGATSLYMIKLENFFLQHICTS